MTEAEWLTCEDPSVMLDALERSASDRKVRLFVCACARRAWQFLSPREQTNLAASEDYANGRMTKMELKRIWKWPADQPLRARASDAVRPASDYADRIARGGKKGRRQRIDQTAWAAERTAQCALLRCVFGMPGGRRPGGGGLQRRDDPRPPSCPGTAHSRLLGARADTPEEVSRNSLGSASVAAPK
jgi:hypothetical protein